MVQKIELLAPAKDYECGVAAINHGADAVYIGAPMFSARASAGNAVSEIEKLCHYAHLYRARVHVALNTILTDSELEMARKMIFQLYEAGVDALIIQDTGILQLPIPPIALHASTQMDNRTPEKVLFLEKTGFQRVILARELSLEQIREIRQKTSVELEAFVHGALCVSYSGQCYMSQSCVGRSANRGECAQFCRLPYTLKDADGKVIRERSHLLSLKDMDRSASLANLLDAGVCSLKIEGRLKNMDYVKNVTGFYRRTLDDLLEKDSRYEKASSGKVALTFLPNPQKTFNRGKSDYFLFERENVMVNPDTPKSIGEFVGKVAAINGNILKINTDIALHNGDGLGFLAASGELCGFRINKSEGNNVATLESVAGLQVGMPVYRNFDIEFNKLLQGNSASRRMNVDICFSESSDGFELKMVDEDGNAVSHIFDYKKELSQKGNAAIEMLKTNLSKLGGTPFVARSVDIQLSNPYFFPASVVNEWRRTLVQSLQETRMENYVRPTADVIRPTKHLFDCLSVDKLTYLGNVLNEKAVAFYRSHGIENVELAYEANPVFDAELMRCKHCIRYSLGMCKKSKGAAASSPEPWTMETGNFKFFLDFDCKKCEMVVKKSQTL